MGEARDESYTVPAAAAGGRRRRRRARSMGLVEVEKLFGNDCDV